MKFSILVPILLLVTLSSSIIVEGKTYNFKIPEVISQNRAGTVNQLDLSMITYASLASVLCTQSDFIQVLRAGKVLKHFDALKMMEDMNGCRKEMIISKITHPDVMLSERLKKQTELHGVISDAFFVNSDMSRQTYSGVGIFQIMLYYVEYLACASKATKGVPQIEEGVFWGKMERCLEAKTYSGVDFDYNIIFDLFYLVTDVMPMINLKFGADNDEL